METISSNSTVKIFLIVLITLFLLPSDHLKLETIIPIAGESYWLASIALDAEMFVFYENQILKSVVFELSRPQHTFPRSTVFLGRYPTRRSRRGTLFEDALF